MAKKKSVKKEDIIEAVEAEVVSFEANETEKTDLDKSIENLDSLIEDIEPIDMSEELDQIRKEIFEEKVVKEEPKKVAKNNKLNAMFGFVWNGMEYDN